MASGRKGHQNIKTMASLVDKRRIRTTAGALMEMSVLANERRRLQQELNWLHLRQEEIEARFAEIAEKESRLFRFVKRPKIKAGRKPLPVPLSEAPPQRVSVRELRY